MSSILSRSLRGSGEREKAEKPHFLPRAKVRVRSGCVRFQGKKNARAKKKESEKKERKNKTVGEGGARAEERAVLFLSLTLRRYGAAASAGLAGDYRRLAAINLISVIKKVTWSYPCGNKDSTRAAAAAGEERARSWRECD